MKKNMLSLILFLCMGVLATSCGDDDNANGKDADQVRISAVIPGEFVASRALQNPMTSHKLRCILELWSKDADAKLIHREEVVVDPLTQSGSLPFDFTIAAGTYDCLMWADYVDAPATDKYYDTSDLKNITVKEVNSLINNEACDAFFYNGEVQKKDGEAFQQEVKMIRPFTKISVKEKNLREFNLLKGLSVSYDTFTKFDVSTGKVSDNVVKMTFNDASFDPSETVDGTLFTGYVFANAESRNWGNIELGFTTDRGIQQVVVPEIIPLLRGHHIKVSGNMIAESPENDTEFEISYDVDIADWTSEDVTIETTEKNPKVGDFFYADGSYSPYYLKNEANPCIGVVFAVANDNGKASGDKPENYTMNDGTQKLQKVRGWVVAAKEVEALFKVYVSAEELDLATLPGSALNQGKTDIKGFANTEVFKKAGVEIANYPAAEQMIKYENDPTTKAPDNTSGWYWGAVQQYVTLATEYAVVTVEGREVKDWEYLSVGKSLDALAKNGAGDLFGGSNQAFYWTSSVEATGKTFRAAISTAAYNHAQFAGWKTNDPRHCRPILTF